MISKKTKKGSGGKRPGAGKKKGRPTLTFSIRHCKTVIERIKKHVLPADLQKMGQKWLNDLNNQIDAE